MGKSNTYNKTWEVKYLTKDGSTIIEDVVLSRASDRFDVTKELKKRSASDEKDNIGEIISITEVKGKGNETDKYHWFVLDTKANKIVNAFEKEDKNSAQDLIDEISLDNEDYKIIARRTMESMGLDYKYENGGSVSDFINQSSDLKRKHFSSGMSKGDLMNMAYGESYSNVDSALPMGLLESEGISSDERWHYVMDYNDNRFGKLTDLFEKISEKNPSVEVYNEEFNSLGVMPINEASKKFIGQNVMFSPRAIASSTFRKGGSIEDGKEIAKIYIGDYPYYIKKSGDSTHFTIVNDYGLNILKKGYEAGSHIEQYKSEPYYEDVRAWLKGGESPNNKKYVSTYANGGEVKYYEDGEPILDLMQKQEMLVPLEEGGYIIKIGNIIHYYDENKNWETSKIGGNTSSTYANGGEVESYSEWKKRNGITVEKRGAKEVAIDENGFELVSAGNNLELSKKLKNLYMFSKYENTPKENMYAKGGSVDLHRGKVSKNGSLVIYTDSNGKPHTIDGSSMTAQEYVAGLVNGYTSHFKSQRKRLEHIEETGEDVGSVFADGGELTRDGFKLGELVYDTTNKRYGTIIGIYDTAQYEVRLDSDGMQPTESLRKLGDKEDKGTKKQLFEAVSSIERLRTLYPDNNYPKLINNPFYENGGTTYQGGREVKELIKIAKQQAKIEGYDRIVYEDENGLAHTRKSEFERGISPNAKKIAFVETDGKVVKFEKGGSTNTDGGTLFGEEDKDGKNGYIAFYKGRQEEVYADTSLKARDKAVKLFKAKKPYEVIVVLAEKDGEQVTHAPMFADGGGVYNKNNVPILDDRLISQLEKLNNDELVDFVNGAKKNISSIGKEHKDYDRAKMVLDHANYVSNRKMAIGGSVDDIEFRKLAKSSNFDIIVPQGRFEIELDDNGYPKSFIKEGEDRRYNFETFMTPVYKQPILDYARENHLLKQYEKDIKESKKLLDENIDLDDYDYLEGNKYTGAINNKLQLKENIKQLEEDIKKLKLYDDDYFKKGGETKPFILELDKGIYSFKLYLHEDKEGDDGYSIFYRTYKGGKATSKLQYALDVKDLPNSIQDDVREFINTLEPSKMADGGVTSPYKLDTEEVRVLDTFKSNPMAEGKVFTNTLVEAKNSDGEFYYNHRVYNPYKDSTEYLGQFRDKEEAIAQFNAYKPKEFANGGSTDTKYKWVESGDDWKRTGKEYTDEEFKDVYDKYKSDGETYEFELDVDGGKNIKNKKTGKRIYYARKYAFDIGGELDNKRERIISYFQEVEEEDIDYSNLSDSDVEYYFSKYLDDGSGMGHLAKGGEVNKEEINQKALKDGYIFIYSSPIEDYDDYREATVSYSDTYSGKQFSIYFNGAYVHLSKTYSSMINKLNQMKDKWNLDLRAVRHEDDDDLYDELDEFAKGGSIDKDQDFYDKVDELINEYNITEDTATKEAYEELGYKPKYTRDTEFAKGGSTDNKLYTAEQLLKKYKGKYIDTYPHHYERKDKDGNWITVYEVRGVSKNIKENYNLPEDELVYEEGGGIDRLNKISAFREKMASYIAYQKADGKNKSDSWYDKTERTLLNKSYQDLYKEYKKLGGKSELVTYAEGGEIEKSSPAKKGNPFMDLVPDIATKEGAEEMWKNVKASWKNSSIDEVIKEMKELSEEDRERLGNEIVNRETIYPYIFSKADLERYKEEVGVTNVNGKDVFAYGGMLDTVKVSACLNDGKISCEDLEKICGHKPNYPKQTVGRMEFEKCFLSPYYKVVKN